MNRTHTKPKMVKQEVNMRREPEEDQEELRNQVGGHEELQTDDNPVDDSATESADNKKIIDILVSDAIKKLLRLQQFFKSKPTPDVNKVERLDMIFNNLYENLVDRGIEGQLAPEQTARIIKETSLIDDVIKIALSQARREFGNFNDPMNPEEQKVYKIIYEMDFRVLAYDMPEETFNLVRDQLLDIVYQTITSKDLKPILCSNAKKRLACRLGYNVKKLNEKWNQTCAKYTVPTEDQVESSEQRDGFGDLAVPELEMELEPVAESPDAMELNRPFLPLVDDQMVLNQAPSMPDINPSESLETITNTTNNNADDEDEPEAEPIPEQPPVFKQEIIPEQPPAQQQRPTEEPESVPEPAVPQASEHFFAVRRTQEVPQGEKVLVDFGKLLKIRKKEIEGSEEERTVIRIIEHHDRLMTEQGERSIWEGPTNFQFPYFRKLRNPVQKQPAINP